MLVQALGERARTVKSGRLGGGWSSQPSHADLPFHFQPPVAGPTPRGKHALPRHSAALESRRARHSRFPPARAWRFAGFGNTMLVKLNLNVETVGLHLVLAVNVLHLKQRH